MRALGFYPTEQESQDLINEIRHLKYSEAGQYTEEVDFDTLVKRILFFFFLFLNKLIF